ncbi:MAG TPA: class I SAM-dependent methyltransferase [Miltoncostaeaceae bacterium]|nr:class I SAM-dependent methyltransferase [Miltoncostaeaceae bacterium]
MTPAPPDAGGRLAAHFGRWAWLYDRQLLLERAALRTGARLAGPLAGRRVVDLAAGTGALAAALVAHGGPPAALVAVDAAPAMLHRARRRLSGVRPAPSLLVADARAVPLPDGAADLVAIGYLLHLLDPADRSAVLAEARRLLVPGGRVVAVVHGTPGGRAGRLYRRGWRAVARLSRGLVVGGGPMPDLPEVLTAAGLRVEVCRTVPGVYWSAVCVARRPAEAVGARPGAPVSAPGGRRPR